MEEYYFLFGIALVWIVFASVQDLRKREVANWLNFSLIAIALAYRGFYSIFNNDLMFFVYGVLGFAVFFALGNLFYYSKVFAGGDAKLLFGLGAVLPFYGLWSFFDQGILFFILLFSVGALYSLIYSLFIAISKRIMLVSEMKNFSKKNGKWFLVVPILVLFIIMLIEPLGFALVLSLLLLIFSFLFVYLRGLDKCLIVLTPASKLTEGDWLVEDIRAGKKWIRQSVHGLSFSDIAILRKARKSVKIKQGVPFVPAFLFAFLIFIWLWINGIGLQEILLRLFGV